VSSTNRILRDPTTARHRSFELVGAGNRV
jgi:hypothetical protein